MLPDADIPWKLDLIPCLVGADCQDLRDEHPYLVYWHCTGFHGYFTVDDKELAKWIRTQAHCLEDEAVEWHIYNKRGFECEVKYEIKIKKVEPCLKA